MCDCHLSSDRFYHVLWFLLTVVALEGMSFWRHLKWFTVQEGDGGRHLADPFFLLSHIERLALSPGAETRLAKTPNLFNDGLFIGFPVTISTCYSLVPSYI